MKIVICVNDCEQGLKLAEFTNRLGFPDSEFHFVHVILPIMSAPLDMDSGASAVLYADAQRSALDDARAKLTELSEEFHLRSKVPAQNHVSCGEPVRNVLHYVEQIKADLIVVGRTERGPIGRLFLGSVSRSVVAESKVSVLVVQTPVPAGSVSIRVLMATDLSSYARQCIEHLYELAPRRIEQLTILNIYDKEDHDRLRAAAPTEADECVEEHMTRLRRSIDSLASEFKHLIPVVGSKVEINSVRTAIHDEMAKTKSDLLILGAHGHTWLERTHLGSVSFRQAFGEPYSVLIMRV